MKTVLNIEIPEGRKAGKFLRKSAPVDFPDQYSELVKSLEYRFLIAEGFSDWNQALDSCQSCQSENAWQYYNVWNSQKNVELVVLMDEQGMIHARCLINNETNFHAPVYGDLHYLLSSRLVYAGYKMGAIAKTADVQFALNATISRISDLPTKIPKSPLIEGTRMHRKFSQKKINDTVCWARSCRANALNGTLEDYQMYKRWASGAEKEVYEMKMENKRFNRACRKQGILPDSCKSIVVRFIERERLPRYTYKEVYSVTEQSKFFLDSEKKFLFETTHYAAGYVTT